MAYVRLNYYLLVAATLLIYYVLPLRFRWIALLCASMGFYYAVAPAAFLIVLATIVISYACARIIGRLEKGGWRRKAVLAVSLLLMLVPLLATKNGNWLLVRCLHRPAVSWIVPLGISFYTLQILAYLVDVYKEKVEPQRNFLKYALFISFFPQIVQGPIPRYDQLAPQLFEGHRFDERGFTKGLQLLLWGFFLKFMVADRTGVIVNTIFGDTASYTGLYALLGGILYSLQLYADFLACVTLSQGAAALFGIQLIDNFQQPYSATSIKEFWRRWHISLSSWLRDYVYIPLGGNRKGRLAKYKNLILTFAVSGVWHGAGFKFLFWGLLHAFYQIVGELTAPLKEKVYSALRMPREDMTRRILQTLGTFFWVMLAWIIFRADGLRQGLAMIVSIFRVWNPWILVDGSLFTLGLDSKECIVLVLSVALFGLVSTLQRRGMHIRDWFLEQHVVFRWSVYIAVICVIVVFGAWGAGYDAQSFIYEQF